MPSPGALCRPATIGPPTQGERPMHKLVSLATVAIIATSISSAASAGEVTGGPKHKATGMRGHAQSICGFSGQEDGFALAVDEFGNPILDEFGQMTFIEVEF